MMSGHWCCGEELEISGITPDGYDIWKCTLCGREE